MANKKIWLGILAALLALTMTLVSCGGGDGDGDPPAEPMEGVWEGTQNGTTMRLSCTGSNWVMSMVAGDTSVDYYKGTFTVADKTVTLTPTHANSNGGQPPNWVAVTGENVTPITGTLSADGKTISVQGTTLTKK